MLRDPGFTTPSASASGITVVLSDEIFDKMMKIFRNPWNPAHQGNDGKRCPGWVSSFPRKRESTGLVPAMPGWGYAESPGPDPTLISSPSIRSPDTSASDSDLTMSEALDLPDYSTASPAEIEDALEGSRIVWFERCPIELPPAGDLAFLRDELPRQTRIKNVSYHPESDSVPLFDASGPVRSRVTGILRSHSRLVTRYLAGVIPNLAPGWTVGTCSFRPLEEQGRALAPRASNELVHIDAGAYGATRGDRILRFFVNVHPTLDRVWGTKGSFSTLIEGHPELLAAARGAKGRLRGLSEGPGDRCHRRVTAALGRIMPLARVLDSSPYDRAMRRIHNHMKESEAFRGDADGYRELRFPPFSAWLVLTDGVSHCVVSGRHALVTTILVPLRNCRRPELAPWHILDRAL